MLPASSARPTASRALPGLDGATALITGAAGGIGAAIAAALGASGAELVLLDRDDAGLDAVASSLDGDARTLRCDLADPAALAGAAVAAGPVDVLVHAAGVLTPGRLGELDLATWQHGLATNLTAPFLLTQAVAPGMVQRGGGSIVTVASNAARVPRVGLSAYAAAKAGLVAFTRCVGLELAPHGVRCNVVSPGSTDTPMLRALRGPEAVDAAIAGDPGSFTVGVPLGRVAAPQDVAEAVAFLASDLARHITLQDLLVDGGASL